MKNLFKKTAMFLMVAIMIMSMCVPAFAAFEGYTEPLDTTNATTTINVHTIMNQYAEYSNPPGSNFNFFDFKIESAYEVPHLGIKEGIECDNVKIYDNLLDVNDKYRKFLYDDDVLEKTYDEASEYPELSGKVNENQKFITFPITIDFSDVNFTDVGVYRYYLSVEPDSNYVRPYMLVDNDYYGSQSDTRYIDVYVENNDTNDGLKIADIVVWNGANWDEDGSVEYQGEQVIKSDSFIFEYETVDLDLTKIITGNQANMSEKFSFKLRFNDSYDHSWLTDHITTSGNVEYENKGNYLLVKLGHNDKITFHALEYGTYVTIEEENGDYVVTYTVDGVSSDDYYFGSDNSINYYNLYKDTSIVWTNDKTGTIPTGVFLAVGPMVGLAGIGGIGMMFSKKRRKDEE